VFQVRRVRGPRSRSRLPNLQPVQTHLAWKRGFDPLYIPKTPGHRTVCATTDFVGWVHLYATRDQGFDLCPQPPSLSLNPSGPKNLITIIVAGL